LNESARLVQLRSEKLCPDLNRLKSPLPDFCH
jgi:hypothetical protein